MDSPSVQSGRDPRSFAYIQQKYFTPSGYNEVSCTNRETAAEKAAAHRWMEKERARRRPRNLWTLEKLKREGEKVAALINKRKSGL